VAEHGSKKKGVMWFGGKGLKFNKREYRTSGPVGLRKGVLSPATRVKTEGFAKRKKNYVRSLTDKEN